MVDAVDFDLVENLYGVRQGLRHIREDVVHLLPRLEPLLLGVEHTGGVVELFSR